ncbi:MAG TPA: LAGLIDADG family homing endonuclease [Geobacterales bacterium]|nr:LAGLIDADG family homing endonuclease [Geobacterales bacterium]
MIKYSEFFNLPSDVIKIARVDGIEYYKASLNSRRLCSHLINKGVTPRKSLTLKYPSDEIIPNELERHFIRGYFDGDGSIRVRQRTYHNSKNLNTTCSVSIVGTHEFLSNMQLSLINKIKISETKLYQHGKNTYEYSKEGIECYRLLEHLYNNSSIFLDRKYNKFVAALHSDM